MSRRRRGARQRLGEQHACVYMRETALTFYERSRRTAFARWQRLFLHRAMVRANWNVTRAADYCGVDRSNFRRMLKAANITKPLPVTEQSRALKKFEIAQGWWRADG